MKTAIVLLCLLPLAAGGLLGGSSEYEAKIDSDEVLFATEELNSNYFTDGKIRTPIRVIDSKKQIVNGVNYDLKIKFSNNQDDLIDVCTVRVYQRPTWMQNEGILWEKEETFELTDSITSCQFS